MAENWKIVKIWPGNYSCSAGWKFYKGRATRISRPFYFSIFKQDFIMISVCEWLIAYGELFNTCKLQIQHDSRWFWVSKQIMAIIAHNVGFVWQLSVNFGLRWHNFLFTCTVRGKEGSWSKLNRLKNGFYRCKIEARYWRLTGN